jgi:hypothetical protein
MVVALALAPMVVVAASLLDSVLAGIDETISLVGGAALLLSWAALLLLGVAWDLLARRCRVVFLSLLACVPAGIILNDAGACLWWRFGAPELWDQTADAQGCLRQSNGWTCYPASAVMLLDHHGIKASEGEMAYRANTTFFGTEDYAMARALNAKVRSRGWHAVVESTDYDTCVRRNVAFIGHMVPPEVGEVHAVFVRKVGLKFVEMIDPLDGVARKYSREEFEDIWVGTLVRLEVDREDAE